MLEDFSKADLAETEHWAGSSIVVFGGSLCSSLRLCQKRCRPSALHPLRFFWEAGPEAVFLWHAKARCLVTRHYFEWLLDPVSTDYRETAGTAVHLTGLQADAEKLIGSLCVAGEVFAGELKNLRDA